MLPKDPVLLKSVIDAANENVPIAELEYIGLSLRVINSLKESKYNLIYIKDLISLNPTQMCKIENLGSSGVKQISKALQKIGKLKDEKAKWHGE